MWNPERLSPLRLMLTAFFILFCLLGCRDGAKPTPQTAEKRAASQSPTADAPKTPAAPIPAIPATPDDWPMVARDVLQSGSASDKTLKPPLAVAWAFKTGGAVTASPIVVGETVYVGSMDGKFYALNATAWGEKWRFRADAPIRNGAAYLNGVVVFSDVKANFYGVNSRTGDLLWKTKLLGWTVSAPVIGGGFVWLGIHPNRMVAYDARSGQVVSETKGMGDIEGTRYLSEKGKLNPQTVLATDGSPSSPAQPFTNSRPVRANGVRFLGAGNGILHVLAANGKELERHSVGGGVEGVPAIARGHLYVPSQDGHLYAFTNSGNVKTSRTASMRVATVIASESAAQPAPGAKGKPIALLNDGARFPLAAERQGWAKVTLPNGKTAWLPPGEWAVLGPAGKGIPFRQNGLIADVTGGFLLPQGGERPVWSPDGETVAYFVRKNLVGQFWVAQAVGASRPDARKDWTLVKGSFLNPHLSWSLDSKWVAFESFLMGESSAWIANIAADTARRIADGDAPAWSPQSHRLAYLVRTNAADELWRVNSDGSDPVKITDLPVRGYVRQFAYLNPPIWSPKGTYIAQGASSRYFPDKKARLVVTGTTAKAVQRLIDTPAEIVRSLEWSPDGEKVACVLAGHVGKSADDPLDQRIYVYWYDGSQPPLSLPNTAPTWIDASRLAYVELSPTAGMPSRVWLVDVNTRRRQLLLESDVEISSLAWVPARKRLTVWSTTKYLRDGKFQPAETRGWLVRIGIPS